MKTSAGLSKVLFVFPMLILVFFLSQSTLHGFNLSSPACPPFTGDTLLAIRAPIGTQLEVPIPEAVSQVFLLKIPIGACTFCLSHISHRACVSRSSTDKENTRYVWRVRLVPLRFCWSIRTRPVPLPSFCPSLLQMTSFRASLRRRLPPSCPLPPPRSIYTHTRASSLQSLLFMHRTAYYIIPAVVNLSTRLQFKCFQFAYLI